MAEPTPIPSDTAVYKMTLFANSGVYGWQEVYYWASSGVLSNKDQTARAIAKNLVKVRSTGMTKGTAEKAGSLIVAVRINQVAPTVGPAMYVVIPELTTAYRLETEPQPVWTGALLRSSDTSNQYHGSHIIRGMPQSWSIYSSAGWNNNGTTAAFNDFIKNFNNMLAAPEDPAQGLTRGVFTIRAATKSAALSPSFKIVGIALDTDGSHLKFTVEGDNTLISIGDPITIKYPRDKCMRGISGRTTAQLVTVQDGLTQITTKKRWCCQGEPVFLAGGSIKKIVYQYFPFAATSDPNPGLQVIRGVKRDTGPAFFHTAGRRSRQCC